MFVGAMTVIIVVQFLDKSFNAEFNLIWNRERNENELNQYELRRR